MSYEHGIAWMEIVHLGLIIIQELTNLLKYKKIWDIDISLEMC